MYREGSAQSARLSTFAALEGRNYRFYWFGLVLYVLGHRAEYVTFAWITWEVARDPLALGYLGLAQGAPLVVFQLFGGVLADRAYRLRLLLATQILTALTLTGAFVLTICAGRRNDGRFEHARDIRVRVFPPHRDASSIRNARTAGSSLRATARS